MSDARAKAARTLAPLVAAELGTGWVDASNPEHWLARLKGPNGAELFLSVETKSWSDDTPTRVKVWAGYPEGSRDYFRTGQGQHEIGVAYSRGAVAIGREITRRLLPGYWPDLRGAQDYLARQDVAARGRDALAERFGEILGPIYRRGSELSPDWPGSVWGQIRLDHAGEDVGLDLHNVPAELALQIARLIKATGA